MKQFYKSIVFVLAITSMVLANTIVFATEEAATKKSYLTPEVEKAIDKGLKWLKERQDEDGSWAGTNAIGMTSIALLAFVANGNFPEEGKYAETVKKGVNYLLESRNEDTGYFGNSMYEHGFATLLLTQVMDKYKKDDLKKAVKEAVELILDSQNKTGGWRYAPNAQDMDVPITSCQILALHGAKKAGLDVPDEKMKKAGKAVKKCAIKSGGFGYAGPDGAGIARTGAGISSLIACGEQEDKKVKKSLEWLLEQSGFDQGWWSYGVYYCVIAMYQAGEKYWEEWYPDIQEELLEAQQEEGEFVLGGRASQNPMDTAFSIITLSIEKGLVPAFQK